MPLSNKKGGKGMLAAAKFDPTIPVPERVVDIVKVELHIQRLAIGGNPTMALPPRGQRVEESVS